MFEFGHKFVGKAPAKGTDAAQFVTGVLTFLYLELCISYFAFIDECGIANAEK